MLGSETLIIIISLFFSAFFSGIEIAYVASDKLHLLMDNRKANFLARTLAYITKKPSLFIGTTLIGNTIALVVYGIFMAEAMEPFLGLYFSSGLVLFIQTIISTFLVLIVAEFLPKSLFMINPNKMLQALSLPFAVIYTLVYIPVYIIVTLSKWMIVYVFKWKYEEDQPLIALTDLNYFVQRLNNVKVSDSDSKGDITTLDKEIFDNLINFKDVRVRDCLIPRKEIVAIDKEDGIEALKDAFIKSGHSKVFVYKKSIDNIIGYCHSNQLFKKPDTIQEILSKIIIVPETELASDLLVSFIEKHRSIALVVDEFGGTSGIVSIEDIIEEIFGEIQDEHDDKTLLEEMLSDTLFIFSARQEIDYLNSNYQLKIPEGEYDTLGGYIVHSYEDIPKINQVIQIDNLEITVIERENTRLEKVKVKINS